MRSPSRAAVQYLPQGLVLAVVDPGVATDRRCIVVEVAHGMLVGPDNGLLAPAVALLGGPERVVVLENEDYQLQAPGPTFAGRDIMAPAIAHIANGIPLAVLGDDIDPASLTPGILPLPNIEDGQVQAEVLWVDRFGNCQFNVDPEVLTQVGAASGRHDRGPHGRSRAARPLGPRVRRRQPVGAAADRRLVRQLRARLRPPVRGRAAQAPRRQHRRAGAARRRGRSHDVGPMRWGTSLVLVVLLVLILIAAIIQFVFRLGPS